MRKERLFGAQNGVRQDKKGIMDVVKKGHFGTQDLPPTALLHVLVQQPPLVRISLELYLTHGEMKSCRRIQVIPSHLDIHYGKPNISKTAFLLLLSMKNLPYMVLLG